MVSLIFLAPFILLACLWGPVIVRRAGLIGGTLAVLLLGACFGYDFFHVSVITLDRLALGGVVFLYFVQRNLHGLKARPFRREDIALLAFYAAIAGITLATDWKWNENEPMAVLLFFYVLPLFLYWVVSRCEVTEKSFKWVLGFFALFGGYLTVTGLLEVMGVYGPIFPRYIVNSPTVEFLGRARGPFLNPIGNGMYLSMAVISSVFLWPYTHKIHRPALVLYTGFLCVGAVCTLTRSVWLGLLSALFVIALVMVPSRHRLRVMLCGAIVGGLGIALAGSSLMSFKRDKNLSAAAVEESAKLRPILAAFAFEMFKDHPVTGVGLSQYRRHNYDYLTKRSFDLPLSVAKPYVQHNVFLSLLVETGLVGVSLFCLTLILWAISGWQLWHAVDLPLWKRQMGLICLAMLAAYFPNGMFHEMSLIPMQNMLLFFVGGLTRNIAESRQTETATQDRRIGDVSMQRRSDFMPQA